MNRIYQGRASKVEMSNAPALSPSAIAPKVHWIRHEKVILDYDLAALYGVEARSLNQAVKRNLDRFPDDFMFRLTPAEAADVRHRVSQTVTPMPGAHSNSSQTVMSSRKHRGHAYLPYAFTEQGVAMLSSVLRSTRAVQVNIAIMRTFVQLRHLMAFAFSIIKSTHRLSVMDHRQFAPAPDAVN